MSKRRSLTKDRAGSRKVETDSISNKKQTNDTVNNQANNEDTSRGEHSETIEKERGQLTLYVDADNGLLDELCVRGVVTRLQADDIRSKLTKQSRVDRLLHFIIELSDEKQEKFLVALDKSQQAHVSEYIRANGNLSNLTRDSWPLPACSEFMNMERNWIKITELMDLKCGLLDELFSEGCISERQMKSIKAEKTEASQISELLFILYSKSFADVNKFFNCLHRTKQSLVISLISTSYTCSDQPLDDVMKSRLIRNHAKLVQHIDTKCSLLAELFASDCISLRQRQYIESAESQADSNSRLLDIIRRGSDGDFNKFIDGLTNAGQGHIATMLLNDGAVAHVVAKTSSSSAEERLIVERFKNLLSESSDTNRENLYSQVVQHVNELRGRGILIVSANSENSIGVLYMCLSLSGLQHLYDLYTSGQLKRIAEHIFTVLLNDEKAVTIDSLQWNARDYVDCMQDICLTANLKTLSELYGLVKHIQRGSLEHTVGSLYIEQFPFELFQLILTKTMGQLFVLIHKVTPLAAVYALVMMSAVSSLWWRTLTYRQYNKHLLQRYFQRVCSPFKCNPQQIQSIHVKDLCCFTELNGKLFIGCRKSSVVQLFNGRSPFNRLEDIYVEGLNDATDIAVRIDASQLFIADKGCQHAIWRVNLLCNKQIEKFITVEWQPWSLSVNSSRLLIIPKDGDALFLYGDDGNQMIDVKLPDYMCALHAVETMYKTYLVGHYNRRFSDPQPGHNSVSEVDVDGRVVRTFSSQHIDIGPTQFNHPHYLAIYGKNLVAVADSYNDRIVILKSDLQLKRVLLPSLDDTPVKLCLSQSSGLLFVHFVVSSNVCIYQVGTKLAKTFVMD